MYDYPCQDKLLGWAYFFVNLFWNPRIIFKKQNNELHESDSSAILLSGGLLKSVWC